MPAQMVPFHKTKTEKNIKFCLELHPRHLKFFNEFTKSFYTKALMAESRELFSQKAASKMFD